MIELELKSVLASAKYSATLIEIKIKSEGGICEPEDLDSIVIPDIPKEEGVILSGRCPVWLFSFLCCELIDHAWIGMFTPRLGGAVIVNRKIHDAPNLKSIVTIPKN